MSDFWVFGYGSLMWRPDFPHQERVPALLQGAHRALCIYSWVHRGTRERPGMVLGLDRGGACRGVAFRVAGRDREAVLETLRARELVTSVYREVWRRVLLLGGGEGGRAVSALTYIADRASEQYAGRLSREALLTHVSGNAGRAGRNDDYVVNTVRHLEALGIHDETLAWLGNALRSGGKG